MKHIVYHLAVSFLILSSCSKSKEEAQSSLVGSLAGQYQASASITAAPIIMYTASGQVNNAALVDKFLKRQIGASAPVYFSRADVPITNGITRIITLDTNNQATELTTSPASNTTIKSTVIISTPQYLVLSGNDSVTTFSNINFFPTPCSSKGEMGRTLNPIKVCHPLPVSTGYYQSCKYRPLQAISIRNGELFIPALSWVLKSDAPITLTYPSNICTYAVGNQRDLFNPAIINQLAVNDTLVVQSREIPLVKK